MKKVISIEPRTPQELGVYDNFISDVAQATRLNPKTVSDELRPLIADVAIHNVGYVLRETTAFDNVVNVLVTITKTDENKAMIELDF